MSKNKEITSKLVLNLLTQKHSDDVFVPECKSGPSMTASHDRLDAWVMPKSWSDQTVIGYEIKVNRSDFMSDKKWNRYLKYCNEFYFVAPKGVIEPDEVPKEAGLMRVASTGTRLWREKVAPRRSVEIPESLFRYILMSRVIISDGGYRAENLNRKERALEIQKMMDRNDLCEDIGARLGSKMAIRMTKLKCENQKLNKDIELLKDTRDRLTELGVDVSQSVSSWKINKAIDRIKGEVPGLEYTIRSLRDDLDKIEKELEIDKDDDM